MSILAVANNYCMHMRWFNLGTFPQHSTNIILDRTLPFTPLTRPGSNSPTVPVKPLELVAYDHEASEFHFSQTQRYTVAGRQLELESIVVAADDGKTGQIVNMAERWNGVPLLPGTWLSRRLNGIVSYALTSRLL